VNIKFITKKIFLSYLFSSLGFILGYLIRIAATRTLNPQQLGLAYSIIYVSSLFANILDFGIRQSFNYLFHEKKDKKKVLSHYLSLKLLLFFLSFLILLIFKPFFMNLLKIDNDLTFYIFFLFFLSLYIFLDLINIISVEIKAVLNSFFNFLKFFFILTIFLFFIQLFKEKTFYLFLFSWIFSLIILIIVLIIYLIKNYGFLILSFSKKSLKELKFLVKKGTPLFFLNISHLFMFYIDTLVVIYFLGHENYSYYNLAYSLLNFPIFLFTTLSYYLFPLTLKNRELIKNYYKEMIKVLFFVIVPFSFLYFLYSKEIVLVVFGRDYIKSYEILSVFSIFLLFYLVKNYLINILAGLKKLRFLLFSNLLVGLINLILNLIAVFLFKKVSFIALATGISWFLLYIILEKKVKEEFQIKIKEILLYLLKVVLQSFILVVIVFFIKKSLKTNLYIEFFLVAVLSSIVYFLLSLLFNTLPNSLKEVFLLLYGKKNKN